ncbi:hypothetical protein GQ42DRAFT_165793 [Ramicandelaber brevisporus]|nr:hypothetical protein GQ42DRAFT_165793 [Ramicandelaber brevisporus]
MKTTNMNRLLSPLLLVAVLLLSVYDSVVLGYTVSLSGKSPQCYSEQTRANDYFAVSYDSGDTPLDVTLTDPNNQVVWTTGQDTPKTNGFHQISTVTVPGRYKTCFSHSNPDLSVPISFYLHSLDVSEYLTDNSSNSTVPLDQEIRTLAASVGDLLDHYNYMIYRDKQHRSTAESTNSRVKWWSIVQCFILIGVTAFQVFYVKSLFEVKRFV